MTSRNADLIIGGRYQRTVRLKNVLESQVYFQDEVTWCTRHAEPHAEWKTFFLLVDKYVFMIAFLALFPIIGILYIFTGYERRPLDIWSSMLVCISALSATASTLNPERTSIRFFYSLMLHLNLILLAVFLIIGFRRVSIIKYEDQISSFDKITAENFRLAADEDMRNYLVDQDLVTGIYSPLNLPPY